MGQGHHRTVPLTEPEEETSCDSSSSSDAEGTRYRVVPRSLFAPPEPLSRSGGTANFFRLVYTGPEAGEYFEKFGGKVEGRWIGKDLAHAKDELAFYEAIPALDGDFQLLHRWCFPYGGVLESRCRLGGGQLEAEKRSLLLLGNCRHGALRQRFLDIKIGEETAVAGWKGKSGYAAVRGRLIDRHTNSGREGFRLEGFDNMPTTLASMTQGPTEFCVSVEKKSRRLYLQRLHAQEFLLHWIDSAELPWPPERGSAEDLLLPVEYAECVLFDTCRQLAQLCADALKVPVPQMWIGSSLALACEAGALPKRRQALGLMAAKGGPGLARVRIFDWGRSELNTPQQHGQRSAEWQNVRQLYWDLWLRGALRILYDAVVLYRRQFSSKLRSQRSIVVVEVYDYDQFSPNTLIGCASLPLGSSNGRKSLRLLQDSWQGEVALKAEVDVEITATELPSTSRLSQAWRVTIHCVRNLPRMDYLSQTDPIVLVKVVTPGSDCVAQAATPVVWNDESANFDWHLDFGKASESTLAALFEELSSAFGEQVDMSLFPSMVLGHNHVAQRWFEAFLARCPSLRSLSRGVGEKRESSILQWGSMGDEDLD